MLIFKPWRAFLAARDRRAQKAFMLAVGNESKKSFFRGIAAPKSGRVYRRVGGFHRASAAGEYPARDTGALRRSIRTRVTEQEATVGTGVFYAKFLRDGTRKMARRRMSDDALREGIVAARKTKGGLFRWVRWRHA